FQAATCVAHSCRFMVGDSSSPTHATRAHPPSRDALHQAVTVRVDLAALKPIDPTTVAALAAAARRV
ncbi:MAG: hypothetical protein ABSF35_19530, partial [Polyangia bacterium]